MDLESSSVVLNEKILLNFCLTTVSYELNRDMVKDRNLINDRIGAGI